MKYHIWTEGCQMNAADSGRVASELEHLGYQPARTPEEADVIVLNTCVVRQSAEDKAYGRLSSLRPLKTMRPDLVINLMGCLVGFNGSERLKSRFPYVDVFSPPSDPAPLIAYLSQREIRLSESAALRQRHALMDGEPVTSVDQLLPASSRGRQVTAFLPVVLGCSHACTYCIIPYRRGAERSRPAANILAEAAALVSQGVKEITLLGQIVDRYGKDLSGEVNLSGLLRLIHDIDGLERIRFLTSHPHWMTEELIDTVAEMPKVMPHIEVPIQAGDDGVLEAMRRGYTVDDYRRLVERIRRRIPEGSIATDIIVGFPGETETQFENTADLLSELRLDVAHLARYSSRPGTVAQRRMRDDVPEKEKWRRFRMLEDLQEGIAAEINAGYLGKPVEVLFEDKVRDRWRGRTPTNKLVFVQSNENLQGQLRKVQVTWTGPWSMQAQLAEEIATTDDIVRPRVNTN